MNAISLLPPVEFARAHTCAICEAEPGEDCHDRDADGKIRPRDLPHFGRPGIPRSRGWRLSVRTSSASSDRAILHAWRTTKNREATP